MTLTSNMFGDDFEIIIPPHAPSNSPTLLFKIFHQIQSQTADKELLLNSLKTEFLLFGSPQQLNRFNSLESIDLDTSVIQSVRSTIGV